MGHTRITVKGLKIVEIAADSKSMVITGPIPGPRKSFVLIKGV